MGETAPVRHLMLPNKIPSTRNWIHLVKSLTKGVPQMTLAKIKIKKSQAIANVINYTPKHDGKSQLFKTSLIYVINHGEIQLVLNQMLHPTGQHPFVPLIHQQILQAGYYCSYQNSQLSDIDDYFFNPCQNQFELDKDLNVNPKTQKLLEETQGNTF